MQRLLPLLFILASMAAVAQRPAWTPVPSNAGIIQNQGSQRSSFPTEYRLFELDLAPLREAMMGIAGPNRTATKAVITLPDASGKPENFEITEASNFHPDLQARFPDIRAYSGRSLTNPGSTLKISLSPSGVQTMVFRSGDESEYMEPYSQDGRIYAVFRRQRPAGMAPWTCSTADQALANGLNKRVTTMATTGTGDKLRTMRLAQSCNAEYSNYFGAFSSADVAKVLAAYNATLTRCNGVYEKDLSLHLNLIPNTDQVIYYVPSSDPYSTNISSWNNALQSTLTNVIGEANYDIGHLFGASGGGGNAGCIGCVCVNGSKGSGITSPADGKPQGDTFDIDYVAHEVGHQLGGNHTFSMSNEGTGQNKEVGSGITIMGYAGITSQDVAPHSIDIFHATSIAQILTNLGNKTCPVTTTVANIAPTVTVPGNFTIPISTPFALTGSATDAAGQALTYCWEQNDNASSTQTGTSSVASATKASGPNWISYSPSASPTRLFPKLATILAGNNVSGPLTGGDAGANTEALSSVSRTLNFRLTVRDNVLYDGATPNVGQTAFNDVVVSVTNTSGPFAVTSPNTAVSWEAGSTQNVTWSVNNTNLAPVNCSLVNILISTDSGTTFTTLVAGTANDGSEAVTLPATTSSTCRIKVEAAGNIFFDIGNTNFTITPPAACGLPSGLSSSAITASSATISWGAVSGATSYTVEYKTTAATTWTILPSQAATTANLTGLASATTYNWRVKTNCAGGSGNYASAQFTTTAGIASCPGTLDTSTNGTTGGAPVIPFNSDARGLLNPSGDVDLYKFSITTGGTISLSLTTLPANFDLQLLNSAGSALVSSTKAGTTSESISYTAAAGTYYARVYSSKKAFNATSCYTVRVNLGTATRSSEPLARNAGNESVTIYPNPTDGLITIDAPLSNGPGLVSLTDTQGRTVIRTTITAENASIDVSTLQPGMYVVRVVDASNKVHHTKIIRN